MQERRRLITLSVYSVFIAIIYYVISLYLLELNICGDQEYYHQFYKMLKGIKLSHVLRLQVYAVGGGEPLYGWLMWMGANLDIAKNQYVSFFNALFAVSLFVLLKKYRVSFVLIVLLLTNYYFIVLLTSAERVKFAYILLINAAIFSGRLRLNFAVLAIFFHFQTFINYTSTLFGLLRLPQLSSFKMTKRTLPIFFLTGVIIATFILVIYKYLLSIMIMKAQGHASVDYGESSLLNIMLLLAVGLFITKQYSKFVMQMLPIVFSIMLFGPARVNMIGFVMFFYLIMKEGKTNHPLMCFLLAYFSFKSYGFVISIIAHGTGF